MRPEEYEQMYRVEDRHWWYTGLRALLGQFRRRYGGLESGLVLDAGCGTGAVLQTLSSGGHAIGLDLSGEALRFCRERNRSTLVQASMDHFPFAHASLDAVVLLDVLYHRNVHSPLGVLTELRRLLRPGGLVFGSVPAYQWLYSSHDEAVHTARRFTRKEVVALLHESGLECLRATYWNSVLFPLIAPLRLWRRLRPLCGSDLTQVPGPLENALCGAALAFERRVLSAMDLPFGLSIFFVARKGPSTKPR